MSQNTEPDGNGWYDFPAGCATGRKTIPYYYYTKLKI
jgi:hypothetical protein